MDGLKEICENAIQINPKDPKVELKYPQVYEGVDVTYMGGVEGFKVRSDKQSDYYHFNAYDVLKWLTTKEE